jgi:ferritin-like metal-binding protein YciE
MKQNNKGLYDIFLDLLKDLFDSENQIVESLPDVISTVKSKDLKKALTHHLSETKNQVQRLKTIFKNLNENPTGGKSKGMQGILGECAEIINKNYPPAFEDVALIIACQKVEHYEIASYGSARTLAEHLKNTSQGEMTDFKEICNLLQENLEEEGEANKKLIKIAEGGFFSSGLNQIAEELEAKSEQGHNKAK